MTHSTVVPIAVDLTPGQAHESARSLTMLDLVRPQSRMGGCRPRPAEWLPTRAPPGEGAFTW